MIDKCSKMGFLVCMLALLIIICTWSHMSDPKFIDGVKNYAAKPATKTESAISSKTSKDTDGDGISDEEERRFGLNPALSDTDGDKKSDGEEGTSNDRDNDGIIDALESALDDSDLDGVADEYDSQNANPDNDSDGDGYGNGLEHAEGSDPLDARSKPADNDKDGIPDNIDGDKNPITFVIIKEGDSVTMRGSLRDMGQIYALKEAFDNDIITYKGGVVMQDENLEDNDAAVTLATKLAPLFLSSYKKGTITYRDKTFEISGVVLTEEAKSNISKTLSENAGLIHFVNGTVVAPSKSAEVKTNSLNTESNNTGESK